MKKIYQETIILRLSTTEEVHRVVCKEVIDDASLSATVSLVCKIAKEDLTYFDVRTNKDNKTKAAVCKITAYFRGRRGA